MKVQVVDDTGAERTQVRQSRMETEGSASTFAKDLPSRLVGACCSAWAHSTMVAVMSMWVVGWGSRRPCAMPGPRTYMGTRTSEAAIQREEGNTWTACLNKGYMCHVPVS